MISASALHSASVSGRSVVVVVATAALLNIVSVASLSYEVFESLKGSTNTKTMTGASTVSRATKRATTAEE